MGPLDAYEKLKITTDNDERLKLMAIALTAGELALPRTFFGEPGKRVIYLTKSLKEGFVETDRFGNSVLSVKGVNDGVGFVEVTNTTAEPDGTQKLYLIRIPPQYERVMTDAREAVAWTFGFAPHGYAVRFES